MPIRTLRDLKDEDYRGKRVFVRVDYNVPIKDGVIQDDTRIRATIPTLRFLIDRGAKVILASHLGRPKGKPVPELSLSPVAHHLEHILQEEVKFVADWSGKIASSAVEALREGEVLLLENLRFNPGEEENSEEFAQFLASLTDIYVNDAFGTMHRAHASVCGLPKLVQVKLAGFLVERELQYLDMVRRDPEHPYVVVLGGAKVKDKIPVLKNLKEKADYFLIGGGMAYTFLKAKGVETGNSIVDEESLPSVMELIEELGDRLLLPRDNLVVREIRSEAERMTVEGDIPPGWIGVDIGESTVRLYREVLEGLNKGTVFWNGPMGIFEIPEFSGGTKAVASLIADATARGITTVLGGGDTVSAIKTLRIDTERFSHVSTGGGATLEYLAGIELPGVVALSQ